MSAETLALAAEAVASPGWRWLPGMRASYHCDDERGFARLVWAKENERGEWYMFPDGDREREPGMLRSGTRVVVPTLPDLDDAATLGCLLALVREAWGRDVFVEHHGDGLWRVHQAHREYVIGVGRTEAAALRGAP